MAEFDSLLTLLIIAIGIAVILFGAAGVGKLFGLLLAPLGCLIKTMFVLMVVVVGLLWLLSGQLNPGLGTAGQGGSSTGTGPAGPPIPGPIDAGRFLRMPFNDPSVTMSEGPKYSDGAAHFGAGLGFDFVKGDVFGPSVQWESFPVVAAAEGVAIRSCEGADETAAAPYSIAQCEGGYGHFVIVRHDATDQNGRHYYTLYAHLDPNSIDASIPQRWRRDTDFLRWQRVRAGDFLGMSDQSGRVVCRSSCIHLHFEVYRGGYYLNPIDPYDISTVDVPKTRDAYPEFTSSATCGPAMLWVTCPSPP